MQFTDDVFINRRIGRGKLAHPKQRLIMVHSFEMIAKRFTAHGNAVFDDFRRFAQRESVSLDGVGRIGEVNVIMLLELRQGGRR